MIKIKEWMKSPVISTNAESNVVDAAKLMKKNKISALVVTENKKFVGLISERDIVYKALSSMKDLSKILVKEIMSKKLTTVTSDASIMEVSLLMNKKNIKRIIIVENDVPKGIITLSDIVRLMTK